MMCMIDEHTLFTFTKTHGLVTQVPCVISSIMTQACMTSPMSTSWYRAAQVVCLLQKRANYV